MKPIFFLFLYFFLLAISKLCNNCYTVHDNTDTWNLYYTIMFKEPRGLKCAFAYDLDSFLKIGEQTASSDNMEGWLIGVRLFLVVWSTVSSQRGHKKGSYNSLLLPMVITLVIITINLTCSFLSSLFLVVCSTILSQWVGLHSEGAYRITSVSCSTQCC